MKAKPRRLISTLLTLSLVLSLIYALPITANAATNNTASTINLEDDWFGNSDFGFAGSWMYDADSNRIVVYDDVEVIGTVDNASETLHILYEAENKNVTWKASYSAVGFFNAVEAQSAYIGYPDPYSYAYSGSFTTVTGSLISGRDGASGLYASPTIHVNITGGTINATGVNIAVNCFTLTMSGGTVTAAGNDNRAICCNLMTVTGNPTINGDVIIKFAYGSIDNKIIVYGGGDLTINGNVTLFEADSSIFVNGQNSSAKITGDVVFKESISDTTAICASSGAEITIDGAVTFEGKIHNSGTGIGAFGAHIIIKEGDVIFKESIIGATAILADDDGAEITIDGAVTFEGKIHNSGTGIGASWGSHIIIKGDVTFKDEIYDQCYGISSFGGWSINTDDISSFGGSRINIDGNVIFVGDISASTGIYVNGSELSVKGDISFMSGIHDIHYTEYIHPSWCIVAISDGLSDGFGTKITINGNVVASEVDPYSSVIDVCGNSIVEVSKDVVGGINLISATYSTTKYSDISVLNAEYFATVNVAGNVIATAISTTSIPYDSPYAVKSDACFITIGGNVVTNCGIGAWSLDGGEITINGEIYAPVYIKIDDEFRTKEEKEPVSKKNGYNEYKGESRYRITSYVWVKDTTHTVTRWTPKLESDLHIRYIFGYPDGSFKPEKAITRAEAVTIFYRLITADDKEAKITSNFTDVKQGDWFYQAVAYLEKYGLIVDSPNGVFRPNDPITRAEYAALASGFDKLDADAPSAFPDVPGDHWAARYINSAAAKGWVKGFDDGKFRPESTLTRAQLVTIVSRMLKRKTELSNSSTNAPKYTDLATSHWAYSVIVDAST